MFQQFRYVAISNGRDALRPQSQVGITFSEVPSFLVVNLDSQPPLFTLASGAENDTLNSNAEFIAKRQPMQSGELVTSARKRGLIHEERQSKANQSFSHRAHRACGERFHSTSMPGWAAMRN